MSLHVDMNAKKVAPMPAAIMERLALMKTSHDRLAMPDGVGRRIAMPART
jgi:acyl-CoA thioester hydrolase